MKHQEQGSPQYLGALIANNFMENMENMNNVEKCENNSNEKCNCKGMCTNKILSIIAIVLASVSIFLSTFAIMSSNLSARQPIYGGPCGMQQGMQWNGFGFGGEHHQRRNFGNNQNFNNKPNNKDFGQNNNRPGQFGNNNSTNNNGPTPAPDITPNKQ